MSRPEMWAALIEAIKKDIPNFEIRYKEDGWYHVLVGKLMFWTDYEHYTVTLYPKVWFESRDVGVTLYPIETLEHEWVHLRDVHTYYGLLPHLPAWFNAGAFAVGYAFPQCLAILALLAFFNPWWLVCLLFLAPWPAPLRMLTELRAYRRSVELGRDAAACAAIFNGWGYYCMWPFQKWVENALETKSSPYKDLMDGYYTPKDV